MIISRIYQWAHSQPKKTALIHNDVQISYAAFVRAIESLRNFFNQQDLPAGQTAIVLVHNLADAWIIILALRALGLNTSSVGSIAHAENLKLRNVACVVVTEAEQGAHNLSGNSLTGTKVIKVPRASTNIHGSDMPLLPLDETSFGGHILFTSGTTGTYKKLLQNGVNEEKRNIVRARHLSFSRDTVAHLFDFPLWTGAGFKQPLAVWHVGGSVILDQSENRFSNVFRHRITLAFVVPPILKAILDKQDSSPRIPNDQTEFAIGGGFIPLKLAKQVVGDLNSKLSSYYSSTETGGAVMYTHFNTKDDLFWFTPVSDRTIQIVDEFGDECPIGQEGRLRVLLTETDCNSYLDDDEASARVFRDGFFYPGDMAIRRADGRIRILGRADDVVNLQGLKRAAAPIEQAIQNALRVDEVCLFSGLDDEGIEELVIAIQSDREFPQSELQAVAREFTSFGRVRFAILKEFPRAQAGMRKIQRSKLRNLVFEESRRVS